MSPTSCKGNEVIDVAVGSGAGGGLGWIIFNTLGVSFFSGRAEELSSTLPQIKNPSLPLLPDNRQETFQTSSNYLWTMNEHGCMIYHTRL